MSKCFIIGSEIGIDKVLNKSFIDRFIENNSFDEVFILIDKYKIDDYKENVRSRVIYIYEDDKEEVFKFLDKNDRIFVIYDRVYLEDRVDDIIESNDNFRYKNLMFCFNVKDLLDNKLSFIDYKNFECKEIQSNIDLYRIKETIIEERNCKLIESGVRIIDIKHTYIDDDCEIGERSIIYPNSVIENGCKIGENNLISSNINNSIIKSDCNILSSYIKNSFIDNNVNVGPYSYIHDECSIGEGSYIGSYVEMKKSRVGKNCKIKHQSVLLDCEIDSNVNVGAGVISANYDGKMKHITRIGKDSFIGCNSVLVAPIDIKDNVFIAADTTVTKNIDSNNFAISRVEQINKIRKKKKL